MTSQTVGNVLKIKLLPRLPGRPKNVDKEIGYHNPIQLSIQTIESTLFHFKMQVKVQKNQTLATPFLKEFSI